MAATTAAVPDITYKIFHSETPTILKYDVIEFANFYNTGDIQQQQQHFKILLKNVLENKNSTESFKAFLGELVKVYENKKIVNNQFVFVIDTKKGDNLQRTYLGFYIKNTIRLKLIQSSSLIEDINENNLLPLPVTFFMKTNEYKALTSI